MAVQTKLEGIMNRIIVLLMNLISFYYTITPLIACLQFLHEIFFSPFFFKINKMQCQGQFLHVYFVRTCSYTF